MKKKLKIENLKVESFVTEGEKKVVKGGLRSNERTCYLSIIYCISDRYDCPTQDIRC